MLSGSDTGLSLNKYRTAETELVRGRDAKQTKNDINVSYLFMAPWCHDVTHSLRFVIDKSDHRTIFIGIKRGQQKK